MYSVKMFLKYVSSHTALKMQCSLSHSLVQYLALKSDTAIFFAIILKQPCLCDISFVEKRIWTSAKIIRFQVSFCSLVSSKKSLLSSTKKKDRSLLRPSTV